MKKWLLLLLSTLLFWGCSDDGKENTVVEDKCATVTCNATETCNTDTGVCEFDCDKCDDWKECNADSSACVIKAGHCDDQNACTDPQVCSNHVCVDPSDPCATVQCEEWQYCETGNCNLKSDRCETKENCEESEVCDTEHRCQATAEVLDATINELRTDETTYLDKIVKTSGIITAVLKDEGKTTGFWMQQKSGTYEGIYVYIKAGSSTAYVAGDSVSVTALYTIYPTTSVHELYLDDDSGITKNGSSEIPAVTPIEATLLSDASKLLPYESMIVTLEATFTTTEVNGDTVILSDGTNTISMKTGLYEFPMDLDRGFSKITGVLERYKDNFRLLPRSTEDLILLPFGCDIAHDGAGCYTWESCVDNSCTLSAGACNDADDCLNDGATCEDHQCVGGTLSVPNGDLEVWENGAPEDWKIGQDTQDPKVVVTQVSSQISVPKLCKGDYDCDTGECNQSGDEQLKHTCFDQQDSVSAYSSSSFAKVSRGSNTVDSDESEFLSPPIPYDPTKDYTYSYWIYDNDPNVTAVSYVRGFSNEAYNKVATMAPNDFSPNNAQWQQRTAMVRGFKYNSGFDESDIVYIRVGIRVLKQNGRDPYDDLEPSGIGSVYLDGLTITAVDKD